MEDSRTIRRIEQGFAILSILLLVAGVVICLQPFVAPSQNQRLLRQVLESRSRRYADAPALAVEYMNQTSSRAFGVALAAEIASDFFDSATAIELYRKLPADGGRWEFMAKLGMARRFELEGRIGDAERELRRALELNPYHLEANSRLGHIFQISGRTWEGIPCFFRLIRSGRCRGDELLGLAAPERFFRADDNIERLGLNRDPVEISAKLAIARRILIESRQDESEKLLREILHDAPNLGEAQGRLGRIIYDRGDAAEFLEWRGALTDESRHHPEVWFVQGLQARRLGQTRGAVRCFLETLTLMPNHLAANNQIASCLEQLGQRELSTEFVRRGEALSKLESVLNRLRNDVDISVLKQTVELLADLGRYWEAAGWSFVMSHLRDSDRTHCLQEMQRWLRLANRTSDQQVSHNPVLRLKRSDYDEPRWSPSSIKKTASTIPITVDNTPWQFRDDAEKVGILFEYYEGTTEATRLQHIFNVVGGGLSATDFDLDGYCDLYLAQANNWRDPARQPQYPDKLFRNLPSGQFQDVTGPAGLGDLGFTHGVATGDFNQDGFPDIYLGNLGPNRLYLNNGDGTFEDVTEVAAVAGNEWTTSSVLADFSGDGLPDLYVANYSLMSETARKECQRSTGEPMACTPDVLTAEFHKLYLNLGDGTFRDVTSAAGMHQPNGRGLAVIAWDFDGKGRLGVFVANDTSPNFLFIPDSADENRMQQFREEGMIRGVALDTDGNAQACMGIAAGDIDGNGRLDMYITNFFGESDTLYSQRDDGLFEDATRQYQLRDAGFWTLGFGCQFADFDGDGWEDIIATNGHVDQKSRRGDPDRMPPQLFHNVGGRRFDEVPPSKLGPFFQRGYLGRGLARLDWNRDGRADFVVSHLHDRLALVTNETPQAGKTLAVRLIARTGARDAIGATVKIKTGNQDVYRLMTGGDGYLVNNERTLRFSTPPEQSTIDIEVRWLGGQVQRWQGIQPHTEILLIEGRPEAVRLQDFSQPAE